jgi:O-antigen ligase
VILLLLISAALLTAWVPERWAVSLFQTGVFLTAAVFVIHQLSRPHRIRWAFPVVTLAGAVAWCLFQLASYQTVYRWATWNTMLLWMTNLLVFFLAAQSTSPRRVLRATLYFGLGLSILATLQTFTSAGKVFWLFPSGYHDFVLGPFVYRTYFAVFIELILPLALAGALFDRRRPLLYAFFAGVLYASVVAAASRAGIIFVSLEIVVILLLALSHKLIAPRTFALTIGALASSAAVFSLIVGPQQLLERLRYKDPFIGRREMNLSSLAMFRDRPLTGFGLGCWPTVYPKYAIYDDGLFANQAHDDWAQWAVEGGVPFLLLMAATGLWTIRPALRSLWGIGLLAVFSHCAVDYPTQKPALAAFVFFMLGLLAADKVIYRQKMVDKP